MEEPREEQQDHAEWQADPPKVQRPASPRLTVVEHVYHQLLDQSPTGSESCFDRELSSDEQPWLRTKMVGEAWDRVDLGWIDEPGMLTVSNSIVKRESTPTEDEKLQDASRSLLLRFGESPGSIEIRSGESCRFEPYDAIPIWVRCLSGETKMTVFCVPR